MKPKYSQIKCHTVPDNKKIWVKTGTQIIDLFWQHLQAALKNRTKVVGSSTLEHRIRSAQFTYWHKGADLWLKTGEMLQVLHSKMR